MPVKVKSKEQIEVMKEGGKITAGALKEVLAAVEVGVTTAELDKIAEDFIVAAGGEPAFKRVPGYRFATCVNLNEGVVHGLPSQRKLKEGDLLSVDLGTYYKGLYTDVSWTVLVQSSRGSDLLSSKVQSSRGLDLLSSKVGDKQQATSDKVKFLKTGERALWEAIEQCRVGNKVRDISAAMESVLLKGGYSPVEVLVGHGIGEKLHEEPQVPCLVIHGSGPELVEGMTLAVEVIYTAGKSALEVLPDGWTLVTVDGSLAGLFEHTVAITSSGPIVLTSLD